MPNRQLLQKILKMKRGHGRKKRYAKLSGATSRTLTRTVQRLEHEGEDRVRVKDVEVYVGLKSFSNQVVNTGSSVNDERMVQYFNSARSLAERNLDEIINQVKDKRYAHVWWDTPSINKINLVDDTFVRLDLFFSGPMWFFVELNMEARTIRRSREYGSKNFAMMKLDRKEVAWVEQIPMVLPPTAGG